MGKREKTVANCFFLRVANLFLRLRLAKPQKWFATTPFLRLRDAKMIVKKIRLPIHDMSYSFRHEGLNSLETKEVNELEETISAVLISIGILRALKRRARRKYRKSFLRSFRCVLSAN